MKNNRYKDRYHGPLITNPVSLGYIKFYPWIVLVLSILLYIAAYYSDPLGGVAVIFISCIVVNLVSILFSFSNWLINQFKSLAFFMISLVVLSLLISIDFIGLMMFVGGGEHYSRVYSMTSLVSVIVLVLVFLGFCALYAWYYFPQNQGKVWAFNQVGNKSKKKSKLNDYLTILGCVFLGSFILTGYIQHAFGVVLALFLTGTLSAVFVDALYAAYYVRKHPESEELF